MEEPTPKGRPTIVGGSPMNRLVQASSLPLNIERLLIRAALNRDFKARLLADREKAAQEAEINLTPLEQIMLSHISDETLQTTIDRVIMPPVSRRRFLKRAAASVVMTLAGSAMLLQSACGGVAPDLPASAYDQPGHYWANLADLRCFVYVPERYEPRRQELRSSSLLLAFPDSGQTSLELAEHWLPYCTQFGIILTVAEWAGLAAEELAPRLPQVLKDARELWGRISPSDLVLSGFAAGADMALRTGISADSPFKGVIAYSGLPAPGWETSLTAREGMRVYIRIGKEDLNAGQYKAVIRALKRAGCRVSSHRQAGRIPLSEQANDKAWVHVIRD